VLIYFYLALKGGGVFFSLDEPLILQKICNIMYKSRDGGVQEELDFGFHAFLLYFLVALTKRNAKLSRGLFFSVLFQLIYFYEDFEQGIRRSKLKSLTFFSSFTQTNLLEVLHSSG